MKPSAKLLFVGVLAAACLLLSVNRIERLSMTEPRFDQAFFAWWVHEIVNTDHILPIGDSNVRWLDKLEGDTQSTLHQVVRNFYSKPVAIFTALPLFLGSIQAALFGFSYESHIGLGIIAAGLIPFLIGVWPIALRRTHPNTIADGRWPYLVGGLAGGLAALLPSFDLIAPLGVHNFGMAGLLVGLTATAWRIEGRSQNIRARDWGWIVVAHAIAFYTHWTNLFLLPMTTFVTIMATERYWRSRIRSISIYALISLCLLAPIMPFLMIEIMNPSSAGTTSFKGLSGVVFDTNTMAFLANIPTRAIIWFETAGELFSMPGLVLGLIGLILMAVRGRVMSPLALVGVHLVVYCLISGFDGARLRTMPYMLPPLALGMAYAAALCLRTAWFGRGWMRLPAAASIALAVAHVALTVPALIRAKAEAQPQLWNAYYAEPQIIRTQMKALLQAVPEDAILFTWDAASFFTLPVLQPGEQLPIMPSPISGLAERAKAGTLVRYLNIRHQSLPPNSPMFLAGYAGPDAAGMEDVWQGPLAQVLGPAGYGIAGAPRLTPVATWPSRIAEFSNLVLYRVELN